MSHDEFAALVELIRDLIRWERGVNTHPNDVPRHRNDSQEFKDILDRAREQLIL